jgi:ABC-2 type transport system permease protein
MPSLRNIWTIFKRELKSYFESPVAYVFMVAFLLLMGFLTFSLSQLYERKVADLQPFFQWHPWVFLILVPASTMGLWAEERRAGTIELLLTFPVTLMETILGKFLAAWTFITLGIVLTFPVVITVYYLGNPDLGVILTGYIGSIAMAGACVAIGMFTSSLTRSQVIGFVLSLVFCFILLLAGWPPVTNFFVQWAPIQVVDAIAAFSILTHYESIQRGVIDAKDMVYFIGVVIFMITATHAVIENRKSA